MVEEDKEAPVDEPSPLLEPHKVGHVLVRRGEGEEGGRGGERGGGVHYIDIINTLYFKCET